MKNLITICCVLISSFATSQDQLYKVTLLRAKPGSLLELIEKLKSDMANYDQYQSGNPYLLRHSQGDHWDLMLINTIPGLEEYFSVEEVGKRANSETTEKPYGDSFFDLISFQEEAIVAGPEEEAFLEALEEYNLFHIEIFTSLAGKQKELLKQRMDENVFYAGIDHRPNFVFTRVFGPSWDIFTIGWYTDLHDFAGPEISFEREDKAAKDAGFEGVNYIGSYLRSLIAEHHDTLAWKVK